MLDHLSSTLCRCVAAPPEKRTAHRDNVLVNHIASNDNTGVISKIKAGYRDSTHTGMFSHSLCKWDKHKNKVKWRLPPAVNFLHINLFINNIIQIADGNKTIFWWIFTQFFYITANSSWLDQMHFWQPCKIQMINICRLHGTVVERRSLTGELSLSCTRPATDSWPLTWVHRPL